MGFWSRGKKKSYKSTLCKLRSKKIGGVIQHRFTDQRIRGPDDINFILRQVRHVAAQQ